MSGILTRLYLKHAVRPRVVHRLPGRIRVHVPALLRLGDHGLQHHHNGNWAEAWREVLALPSWIRSVEVSFATGNALVKYDAAAVSEADVLAFLRSAGKAVAGNWDRLAACGPEELPEVLAPLLRLDGKGP